MKAKGKVKEGLKRHLEPKSVQWLRVCVFLCWVVGPDLRLGPINIRANLLDWLKEEDMKCTQQQMGYS